MRGGRRRGAEKKWGSMAAPPSKVLRLYLKPQSIEEESLQLEDKLRCQLHVAALDVSVGRDTFDGADETVGDVLRAWGNVKIRMVKRVDELRAQLERVLLVEPDASRHAGVEVPHARTTKVI